MRRFSTMKRGRKKKEEVAEDWCFICKDGGLLVVCEYGHCVKSYHHECVGMNSTSPDTNGRWICGRHSCFICHKRPDFQCFGCPNAVCKACIKYAEFVHVKENISFCNDCLKLVMLIEEEIDVDSDGEQVDFKDRDTYECLFKEYWDIFKKGENISLEDLRIADARLKNGENNADEFNELFSDIEDMDCKSDDSIPLIHEFNGKRAWMKSARKLHDLRKVKFVGWGSKKLIDFLTSIGKNTENPIPQLDVTDIIYDYIEENKLIHPERKKKVLCDARLRCLFGRKSVNRVKISYLLDAHFAENFDVEDEYELKSEDKSPSMSLKRQRTSSVISETPKAVMGDFREKVLQVPIICHAAITTKNMKFVYLRRSLIEELLKNAETFESKVLGSFVRIKCDPNDGFLSKCYFQLVQVTGVKKSSETYKIGEISTDFILQVSNTMKDVCIFMVSDGDFTEEECQDLHQRMKDGLLKRPTLVEFEEKARSLHEDITNHWIAREVALLQNLIDRANEKGWRRELFEYIERRQQLQTPSEQARLLEELPKIVADAEVEAVANEEVEVVANEEVEVVANAEVEILGVSCSQKGSETFEQGSGASLNQLDEERENEGSGASLNQLDEDRENEGSTLVYRRKAKRRGTNGDLGKITRVINSKNGTIDLNQVNEGLDDANSTKDFKAGESMNSMEEGNPAADTIVVNNLHGT